ncbi:hypothetical protein V8C42DRAFT_103461 [Trichoderma barbatum]
MGHKRWVLSAILRVLHTDIDGDATVDASTYKPSAMCTCMLLDPRRTVGAVANACRRFQHAHHGHSCAPDPIGTSRLGVRRVPWRGLTRTYMDARIRARTASAPPCHAMSCHVVACTEQQHVARYHVSCNSSRYGEHQQSINSRRTMHANGRHGNYSSRTDTFRERLLAL